MQQSSDFSPTAPCPRRIAGFSCYQGFIYAVFYMGTNRALEAGPFALERADLLATLVAMVAAFAAISLNPRIAKRILASDAAIASCAASIVIGVFAPHVSGSFSAPGLVLEALLVGIPMAVLLVAWGGILGLSSPRVAAFEIFASTGIAAGVCLIVSFFGESAQILFAAALPAASTGILLVSGAGSAARHRGNALHTDTHPREEGSRSASLSRRMLVGAAMFGLAAGLMETLRSNPGSSSTPTFPATLLILALFCIAVLQSLRAKSAEENPLGNTYRIAIAVVMAGFLFTPALYGSGVPGEAIVLAGCLGLTAAFVALFIAVSVLRDMDAALAFCRGFSALYAGEAVGLIAGNVVGGAALSTTLQQGVPACAGLAALVGYLFLFTEDDFRELSAIVDATDAAGAMRDAIIADAKLSQRESQVLELALKGRTNERIAQELVVAKSTVDTHLRRIYAKAGVHSRQELIDYGERLVESCGHRRP